jgi:hypothetical protein
MKDPIAGKGPYGAIFQFDGELEDHRSAGPFEEINQTTLELGQVCDRSVELLGGDVV